MKTETNRSLAQIFDEMAGMHRYSGIEGKFRAIAYSKAAKVIAALPEAFRFNILNTMVVRS